MRIAYELIEADNLQKKKEIRELKEELEDLREQYNMLLSVYDELVVTVGILTAELDRRPKPVQE